MPNTATVASRALSARVAMATNAGADLARKSVDMWDGAGVDDLVIAIGLQAQALTSIMNEQSGRGFRNEWDSLMRMLASFPVNEQEAG